MASDDDEDHDNDDGKGDDDGDCNAWLCEENLCEMGTALDKN